MLSKSRSSEHFFSRATALPALPREKGDPAAALASLQSEVESAESGASLSPSHPAAPDQLAGNNVNTYPALIPIGSAGLAYCRLLHAVTPTDVASLYSTVNPAPKHRPRGLISLVQPRYPIHTLTLDALYRASFDQLEHLIVDDRSKHLKSTFLILWHTGLIYLATGELVGSDPERQLDASSLMEQLEKQGLNQVKEDAEDQFMVVINLALMNLEVANGEKMAGDFHDQAILQDFHDPDKRE
ncbi:hypothetical protein F4777DRAFT_584320 [Nemania sp. FL0916]|nr:hypothetical protein F4777DRAFT_584320 [Nemania sp. FL0916]